MFVLIVSIGQVIRWKAIPANPPAKIKSKVVAFYLPYLAIDRINVSQLPKQKKLPIVYLATVLQNPLNIFFMPFYRIYLKRIPRELLSTPTPNCLRILTYSTGQQMAETEHPAKAPVTATYHTFNLDKQYSILLLSPHLLKTVFFAHSNTKNYDPIVKANPKNRLEDPRQNPLIPNYCRISLAILRIGMS